MNALRKRWRYAILLAAAVFLVSTKISHSVTPDAQALKVQGADTGGNTLITAVGGGAGLANGPSYRNNTASNAAAANNVSIPATAGAFSYLSGFTVTGGGATAGSFIQITISGVNNGPLTYQYAVPAGATVAAPTLDVHFVPPLVGTAVNTAVVVNVPSFGAGNTNASATCYGFVQ